MANKQRYYPHVEGDESVQRAIRELHDHVYDLRDELDAHRNTIAQMKGQQSQQKPPLPYNDNFLGIKLKAVTDPTTLKTGYSWKYNEATGAFELGP
jgi:hypothetical protein